jgi:hypothetical protein
MALGQDNTITAANSLKKLWPQTTVNQTLLAKLPSLATMPMEGNAEGSSLEVVIRYGEPAGVSSQYANAEANITSGQTALFSVKTGTTFGAGEISGSLLAKAETNKGAVLKGLETGQKGLLQNIKRALSFFAFNNGGGAIAQIKAISGSTVTLANASDALWFSPDQQIQFSDTDGTSGAVKAGGPLRVVTVDPGPADGDAVITFNAGVVATIGTADANDFLFVDGTFGAALTGEERNPVGQLGWLTTPGGSDSFFGFNRSVAPRILAGQLASGLSGTFKDQIMTALAYFSTQGCDPDTLIMNPLDVNQVAANLGTLIRYDVMKTAMPKVNFRTVVFAGPGGDVSILPDPTCPRKTAIARTTDTWKLHWAGEGFPGYLQRDGNLLRAVPGKDAYRWRMGAYWAPVCYEPGKNGRILLT